MIREVIKRSSLSGKHTTIIIDLLDGTSIYVRNNRIVEYVRGEEIEQQFVNNEDGDGFMEVKESKE